MSSVGTRAKAAGAKDVSGGGSLAERDGHPFPALVLATRTTS